MPVDIHFYRQRTREPTTSLNTKKIPHIRSGSSDYQTRYLPDFSACLSCRYRERALCPSSIEGRGLDILSPCLERGSPRCCRSVRSRIRLARKCPLQRISLPR